MNFSLGFAHCCVFLMLCGMKLVIDEYLAWPESYHSHLRVQRYGFCASASLWSLLSDISDSHVNHAGVFVLFFY